MAIFSRFKQPEKVGQSDFPKEIPQYEMQIEVTRDKQVIKKLVESDEKLPIYDKIQADNHGLSVYDLLDRFAKGDTSVKIGVIDWNNGDFSATTASLVEMQALMDNYQAIWEQLPLEVRKHYDNDLTKFLNGVDTGEYGDFIKKLNTPAAASAPAPAPTAPAPAPIKDNGGDQ